MRFTVSHKDLAGALQAAARAVPARTTLPALSGILVTAADDAVTLQATDLEMAISTRAVASVAAPGALLLPARYLTDIVRHIPSGTIEVTADAADATATLRWGSSEFVIHGLPAEQFPGLPEAEAAVELSIPRPALRAAVEGTLFAASRDEARPILTGVELTFAAGQMRALGTDGFRIAHRAAPLPGLAEDAGLSAVVPARSLTELLRFLVGDGTVRVLATRSHLVFDLDDVRFLTRVLEGTYPRVMDLVPKQFRARLVAERQALHDACQRVSLLADPLQKSFPTTFAWEDGHLSLTASAPGLGRAREVVPAEAHGEAMSVIFNAQFLAEGLRSCTGDQVVLEVSGPLTAARVTSPQDDGFVYVLMPMRPSDG